QHPRERFPRVSAGVNALSVIAAKAIPVSQGLCGTRCCRGGVAQTRNPSGLARESRALPKGSWRLEPGSAAVAVQLGGEAERVAVARHGEGIGPRAAVGLRGPVVLVDAALPRVVHGRRE